MPETKSPLQENLTDREVTTMMTAMYEMNREVLLTTKKIQQYIFWMRLMTILKLFVIVVPVIFGLWYLSPYVNQFKNAFGLYGELLDTGSVQKQDTTPQNTMNPDQLQQFLEVYRISE